MFIFYRFCLTKKYVDKVVAFEQREGGNASFDTLSSFQRFDNSEITDRVTHDRNIYLNKQRNSEKFAVNLIDNLLYNVEDMLSRG